MGNPGTGGEVCAVLEERMGKEGEVAPWASGLQSPVALQGRRAQQPGCEMDMEGIRPSPHPAAWGSRAISPSQLQQ